MLPHILHPSRSFPPSFHPCHEHVPIRAARAMQTTPECRNGLLFSSHDRTLPLWPIVAILLLRDVTKESFPRLPPPLELPSVIPHEPFSLLRNVFFLHLRTFIVSPRLRLQVHSRSLELISSPTSYNSRSPFPSLALILILVLIRNLRRLDPSQTPQLKSSASPYSYQSPRFYCAPVLKNFLDLFPARPDPLGVHHGLLILSLIKRLPKFSQNDFQVFVSTLSLF